MKLLCEKNDKLNINEYTAVYEERSLTEPQKIGLDLIAKEIGATSEEDIKFIKNNMIVFKLDQSSLKYSKNWLDLKRELAYETMYDAVDWVSCEPELKELYEKYLSYLNDDNYYSWLRVEEKEVDEILEFHCVSHIQFFTYKEQYGAYDKDEAVIYVAYLND